MTVKRPGTLFVRVPSWVDAERMKLTGTDEKPAVVDGYWKLTHPPVGRPLRFEFALPEQELALAHRTRTIHARLRGDEVVMMENFGEELTFFPGIDESL